MHRKHWKETRQWERKESSDTENVLSEKLPLKMNGDQAHVETWENVSVFSHLRSEGAGVCIHLPVLTDWGLSERMLISGAVIGHVYRQGCLLQLQIKQWGKIMAMGGQQKYSKGKRERVARVTTIFTPPPHTHEIVYCNPELLLSEPKS